MIRDDPPTTITGLLTGEDPKPFKPRFVRAALRCAFLAAPMLTLLFAIGAYQLDQHYRVITSFRVQTQFVESGGEMKGGVLIVGTFDKQRNCEFVSLTGRTSDGDVAGVTFMDRRRNEPMFSRPLGSQKFGPCMSRAMPAKASPCTPFTAATSCGRITKKLGLLSWGSNENL